MILSLLLFIISSAPLKTVKTFLILIFDAKIQFANMAENFKVHSVWAKFKQKILRMLFCQILHQIITQNRFVVS